MMKKVNKNLVTSVRLSEKLASDVDAFATANSMTRTSAINFLLTKGLFFERLNDIKTGKASLLERDLIEE